MFLSDLMRKLKPDVEIDFIAVSSYGASTESSGVITIDNDLVEPVEGRHVLLIEDIIDTGHSLCYLAKHLAGKNPASVKTCVLLDKPERRLVHDVVPEYTGFTIPDKFVVGYGLDYAQRYRQLPYIGVLSFEE
jgi:hypoxanthine phosphoribosyltransferase